MHTNRISQESYLQSIGWAKEDLTKLNEKEIDTIYKVTHMTIVDIKNKMKAQ